MDKIRESDLYGPVKEYLDGLGYDTKAEVKDCDIAATKDGELIIIELKTGFTLELIYQALRRQRMADGVYVAVPFPKKGYFSPRYRDMVTLCRQLEIGLIFVAFSIEGKPQIDVVQHPKEFAELKKNRKKRLAVLTEHSNRTGSHNTGGVSRKKILTAYKEEALQIVKILEGKSPLTVKEIKELGGCEKASAILGCNFYKWYRKHGDKKSGVSYSATDEGLIALQEYSDILFG